MIFGHFLCKVIQNNKISLEKLVKINWESVNFIWGKGNSFWGHFILNRVNSVKKGICKDQTKQYIKNNIVGEL